MRISRSLFVVALISLVTLTSPAQTPTTTKSEEPPALVPHKILSKMESLFAFPTRPRSQVEAKRMIKTQMTAALEIGLQAEKDYPNAIDLHEVRLQMLKAAIFLHHHTAQELPGATANEIADRIINSNAPPQAKVVGDFHLTAAKVASDTKDNRHAETDKEIRAFVARYANTPGASMGWMLGTTLAKETPHTKLRADMFEHLKSEYKDDPQVRTFLIQAGQGRGLPFNAVLTRLDGTTLTLPDDLLGKVVVVDFWATWCAPCIAEIPHMKQLYTSYKPKGMEIVGIGLDQSRADLEKLIKEREMNWIHTWSGNPSGNPTARRYGVTTIPSIWVVGKDGKIGSTDARGNLEPIIRWALKQPDPVKQEKTQPSPTETRNTELKPGG